MISIDPDVEVVVEVVVGVGGEAAAAA